MALTKKDLFVNFLPLLVGAPLIFLYWWFVYGTPLHRESWTGNATEVGRLLEAGAEVNATVLTGDTPLHWAALGGHLAVAQVLVDGRASVAAGDIAGVTPLHWAADGGHCEIVQLLLNAGAKVNVSGKLGASALHRAARNGHAPMVRLLLDVRADTSATDVAWNTPRDLARQFMHNEVLEMLPYSGNMTPPEETLAGALAADTKNEEESAKNQTHDELRRL